MKKNINYYEGEEGEEEKIPLSAFELAELIDQRIEGDHEKKPKGWKKEINSLIFEYNERFGRTYSLIK